MNWNIPKMIKNILSRIFFLIVAPGKTWAEIKEKDESTDHFLNNFLYPVMGVTALSVFGGFFGSDFTLEKGIKLGTICFVKYFVGFYLCAFLIEEMSLRIFEMPKNIKKSRIFSGYLLSISMVITFAMNLLPNNFSFLAFAPLYIVYVVWEGIKNYFEVPETKKMLSTIFISIVVLLSPMIIERIMYMLMPGIKG